MTRSRNTPPHAAKLRALSRGSTNAGFFNGSYAHFLLNALDYLPRKADEPRPEQLRMGA
jgi:hypothetical protein